MGVSGGEKERGMYKDKAIGRSRHHSTREPQGKWAEGCRLLMSWEKKEKISSILAVVGQTNYWEEGEDIPADNG